MDHNKAPGEEGITNDILLRAFKILPKFITSLFNSCVRSGCFPKRWKRAKTVPIIKYWKENSSQVSKFRPISLISTGGKMLENALINGIMHHANTNNLLNRNQYGFTPQAGTIDAAMSINDFVEASLEAGQIVVLVSLDVRGAFDAAWWPAILNTLQELHCPRNLYNFSKCYFHQRTATLSTNNEHMEVTVNRGCPQGSCCGPGFWNLLYNSLLNLDFTASTKAVAFADDLLLAIKGETVSEAENLANIELGKISTWAKNNKMSFN